MLSGKGGGKPYKHHRVFPWKYPANVIIITWIFQGLTMDGNPGNNELNC